MTPTHHERYSSLVGPSITPPSMVAPTSTLISIAVFVNKQLTPTACLIPPSDPCPLVIQLWDSSKAAGHPTSSEVVPASYRYQYLRPVNSCPKTRLAIIHSCSTAISPRPRNCRLYHKCSSRQHVIQLLLTFTNITEMINQNCNRSRASEQGC